MSLFGSIFKGAGKIGSQVGSFFGGGDSKYKSENDLPWFERSLLKAGAGLEGIDKKIMGIVGLEDYAPSSFTDIQDKIKTDISQKGILLDGIGIHFGMDLHLIRSMIRTRRT